MEYLQVHELEGIKLDPRAKKCVFVGYSNTFYRCYHPLTPKIHISIDVIFNELEIFYQTKRTQQKEQV